MLMLKHSMTRLLNTLKVDWPIEGFSGVHRVTAIWPIALNQPTGTITIGAVHGHTWAVGSRLVARSPFRPVLWWQLSLLLLFLWPFWSVCPVGAAIAVHCTSNCTNTTMRNNDKNICRFVFHLFYLHPMVSRHSRDYGKWFCISCILSLLCWLNSDGEWNYCLIFT